MNTAKNNVMEVGSQLTTSAWSMVNSFWGKPSTEEQKEDPQQKKPAEPQPSMEPPKESPLLEGTQQPAK